MSTAVRMGRASAHRWLLVSHLWIHLPQLPPPSIVKAPWPHQAGLRDSHTPVITSKLLTRPLLWGAASAWQRWLLMAYSCLTATWMVTSTICPAMRMAASNFGFSLRYQRVMIVEILSLVSRRCRSTIIWLGTTTTTASAATLLNLFPTPACPDLSFINPNACRTRCRWTASHSGCHPRTPSLPRQSHPRRHFRKRLWRLLPLIRHFLPPFTVFVRTHRQLLFVQARWRCLLEQGRRWLVYLVVAVSTWRTILISRQGCVRVSDNASFRDVLPTRRPSRSQSLSKASSLRTCLQSSSKSNSAARSRVARADSRDKNISRDTWRVTPRRNPMFAGYPDATAVSREATTSTHITQRLTASGVAATVMLPPLMRPALTMIPTFVDSWLLTVVPSMAPSLMTLFRRPRRLTLKPGMTEWPGHPTKPYFPDIFLSFLSFRPVQTQGKAGPGWRFTAYLYNSKYLLRHFFCRIIPTSFLSGVNLVCIVTSAYLQTVDTWIGWDNSSTLVFLPFETLVWSTDYWMRLDMEYLCGSIRIR